MEILVIVAVAIVVLYVVHTIGTTAKARSEAAALERVNAKHGTHFSLSKPELVMTESPPGVAVRPTRWIFDPDARKICVLGYRGGTTEVIDFSYIRKFKLEWNQEVIADNHQRTVEARLDRLDYKIVFSTTDLKRPTLQVRFGRSEGSAKLWLERLELIFAGAGPS